MRDGPRPALTRRLARAARSARAAARKGVLSSPTPALMAAPRASAWLPHLRFATRSPAAGADTLAARPHDPLTRTICSLTGGRWRRGSMRRSARPRPATTSARGPPKSRSLAAADVDTLCGCQGRGDDYLGVRFDCRSLSAPDVDPVGRDRCLERRRGLAAWEGCRCDRRPAASADQIVAINSSVLPHSCATRPRRDDRAGAWTPLRARPLARRCSRRAGARRQTERRTATGARRPGRSRGGRRRMDRRRASRGRRGLLR